jgi:hypothetical protein
MLECVLAHGLPTVWRLERGPWENNFIDGIKLGVDCEGQAVRWGGLDPIITISRAWKSKQKGTVEGSFDHLQTLLAHESMSIGRHRGEFEQATKLFLAAGRGDAEAWKKFWTLEDAAEGFRAAMLEFNQEPKQRRAHGRALVVPEDLYRAGGQTAQRACPESELWRFCPFKGQATVRAGHIEKSVAHYPLPFRFQVNGVADGLHLEHGYPVLIAFHPGHPERGCHIFNADTGPRNREGFAFGQALVVAPLAVDAPQVNLAPQDREFSGRRNAKPP